ncbi:hypothetical protein SLEP1_g55131 [Rubroshorea leprosula]|uniref:Uncharacterized protein n=1 Tax=Rubroshorea leprosula TaxID=152421 RepID=A0AAV5MI97_9ROSI|nr:hypothetical protein SLEP1_g55131 [Rubroshorea leprosula]
MQEFKCSSYASYSGKDKKKKKKKKTAGFMYLVRQISCTAG